MAPGGGDLGRLLVWKVEVCSRPEGAPREEPGLGGCPDRGRPAAGGRTQGAEEGTHGGWPASGSL